jgi:hypothetical protein
MLFIHGLMEENMKVAINILSLTVKVFLLRKIIAKCNLIHLINYSCS